MVHRMHWPARPFRVNSTSVLLRASALRLAPPAKRIAAESRQSGHRTKAMEARLPARNHRCIKVGTAQLRIGTGSENNDIKSPGTTQHKAGDRDAAKNMVRNRFTRRTSVLVCRE